VAVRHRVPEGEGCLKPAWEPILLARKPGPKVLPLGIDGCRVPTDGPTERPPLSTKKHEGYQRPWNTDPDSRAACEARRSVSHDKRDALGRYPANVLHDGSDEVLEAFAAFGESKSSGGVRGGNLGWKGHREFAHGGPRANAGGLGDVGTAARFFYCAKASKAERGTGNAHPTVKPLALMRWMVRLVCPVGGRLLDPFAGSGSTLVAAATEGRQAVGVELDESHAAVARKRVAEAMGTGLLAGIA
jgi:hypothetical protein